MIADNQWVKTKIFSNITLNIILFEKQASLIFYDQNIPHTQWTHMPKTQRDPTSEDRDLVDFAIRNAQLWIPKTHPKSTRYKFDHRISPAIIYIVLYKFPRLGLSLDKK